jgi:hypothetical protein
MTASAWIPKGKLGAKLGVTRRKESEGGVMQRDFYVYYLDDENGQPFYVGCSCTAERYANHISEVRYSYGTNKEKKPHH